MCAPWNVRVTAGFLKFREWKRAFARPDYYRTEVRIKGRWYDAGTSPSWLEA